jgi:SulP family sulfate permease
LSESKSSEKTSADLSHTAQSAADSAKRQARQITSKDLIAGVTNAVTNIPDAMASAVLAGLNPIQGLYAIMIGTPVASLTTGSQVMTVAVTGAMALIVGDSLVGVAAEDKLSAVVVLTLLVGLVQILLGAIRSGSLLRFVSNAVLRGFLTGVAVNIVLSQFPDLTGYTSEANNKVIRAIDTLLHPRSIDLRVLGIGLLTIAVILLIERTRAKEFSFLVALLAASIAVKLLQWDLPTVRSLAEIPNLLPSLTLPDLSLVAGMVVPAASIAIVGLIQASGVSKSTPNRDGNYPDTNRDFMGQGIGNVASGLFGGMPVGGSVSSTALVVQMGGRSRIVNFIVGPIIAIVVLFLSGAVEQIPLTTLAAILVVVGVRAIDLGAVKTVWETSVPPRAIMGVTFVAVLILPVQYAVMLGVALSFVQYVYSASLDVRVVALAAQPDGQLAEIPAPKTLPDSAVTVLEIYGSVFYAGADVIGKMLPDAAGSKRPVAVLRFRGRTDLGSTFLAELERYRAAIAGTDGRLMLAGVGPELREQLQRTGMLDVLGDENVFAEQPVLGASIREAISAGEAWLSRNDTSS